MDQPDPCCPPSPQRAFYVYVEDMTVTQSKENLCWCDISAGAEDHTAASDGEPCCDFVLRPNRRFRHTIERAALKPAAAATLEAMEEHIVLGRQRRAKLLAQRKAHAQHDSDRRLVLEEQTTVTRKTRSQRLAEKLESAAQRRESHQKAKHEQHISTERRRAELLHTSRLRRIAVLSDFSTRVSPLLQVLKDAGLSLRGATRLADIETILRDDPKAFCSHCNAVPTKPLCPTTRRTHPRRLVTVSEALLRAVSQLREDILLERSVKHCSPEDRLPKDPPEVRHTLEEKEESSADIKPLALGLPHHLPLAFYQAADHAQQTDVVYASKSVVLALEDLYLTTKEFLRLAPISEEDAEPGPTTAAADRLRAAVLRFAKSWGAYVQNVAQARGADQSAGKTQETNNAQLRAAAIKTYLEVYKGQRKRVADLLDSDSQEGRSRSPPGTPSTYHREKIVKEKRKDFDEAVKSYLQELRVTICRLGGEPDLDEMLTKLVSEDESSHSTSSAQGGKRPTTSNGATSDGCFPASPPTQPTSVSATHSDPCDSFPDSPSSANMPNHNTQPTETDLPRRTPRVRTSTSFRAQLAADRAKAKAALAAQVDHQ